MNGPTRMNMPGKNQSPVTALTGLCWGGVLPSSSALLGLRATAGRRGAAYGVMASATSLGSGAGPLAA